jgi:hypothetical protein
MIMVGSHVRDMTTETSGGKSGAKTEDDRAKQESSLFSIYRRYIGEPDSQRDVYAGFGLFFGGIALGVVGLILFLYSGTYSEGADLFWRFREVALVAAMLALPAVAMSVAVLLPVGIRTMAASLAGSVICVLAIVWLTLVYPFEWTDGNDVSVISTYAAGLIVLAASTGSALVAQYVDRVAPGETGDSTDTASSAGEGTEAVTDEQVEADIEEAMSDSTLTWGGVEQEAQTERLKLNMPDTEIDPEDASSEFVRERRSQADDVDNAVADLRRMQGGEQRTDRTESSDDQVDKLTRFREEQEQDEELETGVDTDRGLIEWIRQKLFG